MILLKGLDNYSLTREKNCKKQTFRKNAISCRLIETVFLTIYKYLVYKKEHLREKIKTGFNLLAVFGSGKILKAKKSNK
jgi:hypothetical protein